MSGGIDGSGALRGDESAAAIEAVRSRLPNLVMVGLGKAGTTSLFYYLSQHPEICSSDVKEIQYFRPLTDGDGRLGPVEIYAEHFSHWSGERYRLEASPQYLHGGDRVISAMRALLGEPRIIISLRDPVDRMWSTYRFAKARGMLPGELTFGEYVSRCEAVLDADTRTPSARLYRTLAGGVYVPVVRRWLDAFGADGRVVFFEHLAEDARAVVGGLCRWLAIDDSRVDQMDYATQNATRAARSLRVHRFAMAVNSERLLGGRRRFKAPLRQAYYYINGRRSVERMAPELRSRLQSHFAQANAELRADLVSRGYREFPEWLSARRLG